MEQPAILEVVLSLVPSVVPAVVPRGAQVQVFKQVLAEALAEALAETWAWEVLAQEAREVLGKSPAKEVGVRLRALGEPAPLVVVLTMLP